MAINTNIAIEDASYNTHAPFTWESTMTVNGFTLSYKDFLSFIIYCRPGIVPPVHICSVRPSEKVRPGSYTSYYSVCIADSSNTEIGYFDVYSSAAGDKMRESIIYNKNDIQIGHVYLSGNAMNAFMPVQPGAMYRVDPDAFVLLPTCHVPYPRRLAECIEINGKKFYTDVRITFKPTVHVEIPPDFSRSYPLNIGVASLYTDPDDMDGFTTLCIRHRGAESIYDVAGKHLMIKSTIASNVRVISDSGSITITGPGNG